MEWAEIITLLIVVLIMAFLLWRARLGQQGVSLPKDLFRPWDNPITKVLPVTCMGFNAEEGMLINQQVLPKDFFFYKDSNGKDQKGVLTPRMGTVAYKTYSKDGSVVKDVPAYKGNYKDCCKYLMENGSRGAAIANGDRCYVFSVLEPIDAIPIAGPYEQKNIGNIFPLWDRENELRMVDLGYLTDVDKTNMLPDPGTNQMTYMVACGGEGYLPCLPKKCTTTEAGCDRLDFKSTEKLPGATSGCSQSGGSNAENNYTPTVPLYRLSQRNSLPYSANPEQRFQICQTKDFHKYFGYDPDTQEWNAGDLPLYNPKTGENNRFMLPEQVEF